MSTIPPSVMPVHPGAAPTAVPAMLGAPGYEDSVAAFAQLLVRLTRDPAASGNALIPEEAVAQTGKPDDMMTPEDVWAAIWFPAAVPSPGPQAAPAPSPADPETDAAEIRTVTDSVMAAATGRGVGSRPSAAADGTAIPVNAVDELAPTGVLAHAGSETRPTEITPAEILALVESAAGGDEGSPGKAGTGIPSDPADPVLYTLSGMAAPTAAPSVPRDAPVQVLDLRHAQAPAQLAESIAWHLDQGVQEVSIDLHPVELGKIEIRIKLEGERVDLRIDTADTSVRDVVHTSLPNLAAMLSARGLQLDQAQVFAQARPFVPMPAQGPANASVAPAEGRPKSATGPRVIRRRLIDDYV